jgi:hypothetical protein
MKCSTEYLQVHSAITTESQTRHFVISLDPSDVLINFVPKSQAQTTQLAFVVRDCVQQLSARFGQELDVHRDGKRPAISFLICS